MALSPLKILFVCSHFTYPKVDHAGGTGYYNYMKWLSQKHIVSLISFIQTSEEEHISSMKGCCSEMELIRDTRSILQKTLQHPLRRIFHPKRACYLYSTAYKKRLSDLLQTKEFDIVHLQGPWMGQYLDVIQGTKTILDEVDVHSLVAYRQYQNEHNLGMKLYNLFEWVKCQSFELTVCQQVDLVLTRSKKDKNFVQSYLPHKQVELLLPWFEGLEEFSQISERPAEPRSILFMGTMSRLRNIEAVLYFYEKIFPMIRKEIPGVKFYIVGSSPSEKIQNLANDQDVVVTGYVEDIGSFYQKCSVFVAPILVGGGIIVKILNAMAAGRPVVTTAFGNEGIGAIPENEIRVAQAPQEFAQKTVDLLTNHSSWLKFAQNGRVFVNNQYNWEDIMQSLEETYYKLF